MSYTPLNILLLLKLDIKLEQKKGSFRHPLHFKERGNYITKNEILPQSRVKYS